MLNCLGNALIFDTTFSWHTDAGRLMDIFFYWAPAVIKQGFQFCRGVLLFAGWGKDWYMLDTSDNHYYWTDLSVTTDAMRCSQSAPGLRLDIAYPLSVHLFGHPLRHVYHSV